jgi:predicted RecB family nuclease
VKIRVAWRDFIGRLESFSSDIYLFHYGSYERQVLEGLGSRTDQARLSPRLFDLLPSVTHHASLPSRGFSLKVVAGELGFWWEDDDADGRYAGKWWDLWRRKRDSEAFNRLRQYNADDLRALALVREWFLEFPDCIPSKRRLKLLRTRATRIEIVERHRVLELCLG